jgi:hypothetical protein
MGNPLYLLRSARIFLAVSGLVVAGYVVATGPAVAQPDILWWFQGIEDINAMATLPDVDGDGVADVLVETYDAGASGDHLYLLSGGSSGTPGIIWSARPSSGASDGGGYGDFCLATSDDLSGDGFPDVLLGTAWGNRSVHALNGVNGDVLWTFDTYNEPDSGWIYCVVPHPDRTGDGVPEVLAGAGSDADAGYLLDGARGTPLWRFVSSNDAVGHAVSLPDFNGDDVADVLFCGWDNEDRVFCVNGAGTGTPVGIWSRDNGASNYTAALLDDVNGDGLPDVVVGNWSSADQVKCLSGFNGDLLWTFHNGTYEYIMRLVPINDLDGDGVRDLAVGSWAQYVSVVSGADGGLIWRTFGGSLNGGNFWAVDRVDDVTGDGKDEVVGGSFDTNIYLFDGVSGDILWTYLTGYRLYSVRGTADLSQNSVPDVLGGTQYLSSGGRLFALEGGEPVSPVPDLPEASGIAGWLPSAGDDHGVGGGVELRWTCTAEVPFRIYRLTAGDGKATAARQHDLALAFEQGALTTRQVLQAHHADKSGGMELITPEPVRPLAPCEQGWRYRFVDRTAPASTSPRYRFTLEQTDGTELPLFELEAAGEMPLHPVFLAASVAPNPFNPRTRVVFELDRAARVGLEIHDLRGRQVFARAPQSFAAGRNEMPWQGIGFGGRELATGVYLVTLTSAGERRVLKASLVR